MDEIEIPEHFLCPISIQLMKDPVILSTGITYDRDSIEKWLYSSSSSCKNVTCPVTKQELSGADLLTPNHTLRRLIQSWCVIHSGNGIDRIPTPCSPVTKTQILKLFQESNKSTKIQLKCVKTLKSIVQGCQSNRKCFVDAGGVHFLASIMKKNGFELEKDPEFEKIREQALDILCNLELSDKDLKKLTEDYSGRFLESLIKILQCGDFESRSYAIRQIQCMYSAAADHLQLNTRIEFEPDPTQLIEVNPEIFVQTIQILRDQVSQQGTKAALKLLLELCKWGRNRIYVVKVGAVPVLIEILLDTSTKRVSELIMAALDQLCRCAEGRAEFLEHGAGLAVVSKKILRVSPLTSEKAVRILSSIAKCSSNSRVLQEMMHVGVVAKLCLVLRIERNPKTVERTKEILVLHSQIWKDSLCIPFFPTFLK